MNTFIYKSSRKDELYLYISKKDDFSNIPQALFDSMGKEAVNPLAQECDRFIVTDQRKVGNVFEKQALSAFNIIGVSIRRAMQMIEYASKLVTRSDQDENQVARYTWEPRNNNIDDNKHEKCGI